MLGHGQLAARFSKAGPARLRKRSDALSSLYVMVRLTKAANGNGSVPKVLPPVTSLGTSTPVAATIFFICSSTIDRLAAGLGQSVPFMNAGFQTPRVTSAEK
jgi:hypothetical protein